MPTINIHGAGPGGSKDDEALRKAMEELTRAIKRETAATEQGQRRLNALRERVEGKERAAAYKTEATGRRAKEVAGRNQEKAVENDLRDSISQMKIIHGIKKRTFDQERRASESELRESIRNFNFVRNIKTRTLANDKRAADMERQQRDAAFRLNARGTMRVFGMHQRYDRGRGRAEESILNLGNRMQSKLEGVVTPAAYRVLINQNQILSKRLLLFETSYGGLTPAMGALGSMREAIGTETGSYRNQNIARLGYRGMRAAEDRSFIELGKIEGELKRIEKINTEMLKQDSKATQGERADAKNALNAAARARAQIAAGKQGNSPLTNMIGSAVGKFAAEALTPEMEMAGGIVAAGGAILYELAKSPFTAAHLSNRITSASARYANFRIAAGNIGIGAGVPYLGPEIAHSLFPGNKVPGWMARLGISPEQALSLLPYTPHSTEEAIGLMRTVGMQQLLPGIGGLPFEAYQRSAQLATTLGVVGPSAIPDQFRAGQNLAGYFSQLQRAMTAAVTLGIDRSRAFDTLNSMVKTVAMTGSPNVNTAELANFYAKMASSGNPMMRSGEGETTALQQMSKAWGGMGFGGSALQSVVYSRYLQRHGGLPKSKAALTKLLGADATKDLMRTPEGQRLFNNALAAAQSGNIAAFETAMAPIVQGHPDMINNIISGSGLASYKNPFWRDMARAAFLGVPYTTAVSQSSGTSLNGLVPPSELSNIGPAVAQSGLNPALIASVMQEESGFKQIDPKTGKTLTSPADAKGLMQLMPATAEKLAKEMGTTKEMVLNDPATNARAGALYLREMIQMAGGDIKKGLELYNWGDSPSRFHAIMSGQGVPASVQKYAKDIVSRAANPNYASAARSMFAGNSQIGMGGSAYAFNTMGQYLGSASNSILTFTNGVNNAAVGLEKFTAALLKFIHSTDKPGVHYSPDTSRKSILYQGGQTDWIMRP